MEIKTAAMKPQINRFFERIINMIIDRERVKNTFAEYTSGYNATDPKIKLKIDHTYRVAELCELIARNLKLDEYETDVAWLTGMLHDVGRFEQIKRYNTFNDAQSVDHANFGADLLFKEGLIDTYVDGFHDDKYGVIVENAIRNHSAFRIDERLDDYTVMFCNILRDADKVDIFRVNIDTPAEDIYNVTTEELKNSQVSPEVMAAFDERHAVLRSCKKTVVDHVAGHIALTFELVYPISLQIAKERIS